MRCGVKSYMRKGFLIFEEMGKFFPIYEETVSHNMTLHPIPYEFPYIWRKFSFLFYQCGVLVLSGIFLNDQCVHRSLSIVSYVQCILCISLIYILLCNGR
jgi:hypothetical protein